MKSTIAALSRRAPAAPRSAGAAPQLNVVTTTQDLGVHRPGSGRRQDQGDVARQGLPGSALRRGEAELRPDPEQGASADRRRARSRAALAAAAHHAEPQREDPAGRRRAISTRRQSAKILEMPTGADHARDGRRPPARQPALLARSGERPPDREGHQGQAVADGSGQRRLLRGSARRTSSRA